jgi:hypothetical protein
MANDQISLDEYIKQLNTRVEDLKVSEQINFGQMGLTPIEPLDYTYTSGGSFHSGYGAVPNVTIGSTTHTSATGINVSSPVWTTTTNNTGGYIFANQNIQPNNTIQIKGENADLLINEKSLKTWMEKVEERLNILTPNPEMEKEWGQLRKLGERYRKLEKKCQEQSDMWKKLKSMPRPDLP